MAAMDEQPTFPVPYELSLDADRLDRDKVHGWLSRDAYRALGRLRETQDRAIDGSLNFGVYDAGSGEQVAYARAVTDGATFAWLCDVYVARGARGAGVGTALVAAVRARLREYGVRRTLLCTEDAHGLYRKSGFSRLADPERWMTACEGART